ncbi:PREDICTED: uncharacterized protein LOC104818610 [Tarenaya hassleriana]|uniref:uncharacterized protein LOC104818604 n=1 Tax=Tarenaya hassleriana TaxID=28532 RepID=UPI00053C77D3|nr:PREDICTED: uncharacterized protein LOC104818604 [Tarenaya hassleriana]XP_010546546.1 PREDICTED: uncharacterized protein LOC104818610 [Tarenaya hassleriana]
MAAPLKSLAAFLLLLLLCMVSGGRGCTYSGIQIGTERTGREIEGEVEWKVTVTNTCDCLQKHVTLSCKGFSPVKRAEPWLMLQRGDSCLLVKGEALPAKASAQFTYAGQPYIFRPIGSMVDPSCNKP